MSKIMNLLTSRPLIAIVTGLFVLGVARRFLHR